MIKVGITGGKITAASACVIASLKIIFPLVEVCRTRRFEKYSDLNLIFGGGIHDGRTKFDPLVADIERRPNGKELRLFGLFWKAFGESVCYSLVKSVKDDTSETLSSRQQDQILPLARLIDQQLVSGIDDEDGYARPENLVRVLATREEEERPMRRSFSEMIVSHNPVPFKEDTTPQSYDRAFSDAVDEARRGILNMARHCLGRLESDMLVQEHDKGQPILVLPQSYYWLDVIRRLPHVNLVVYPDPNVDRNFRVESPMAEKGVRKPIPAAWVAASVDKQQDKLVALTGVQDVVMADYHGRWISARSEAGALALAEKVLAAA